MLIGGGCSDAGFYLHDSHCASRASRRLVQQGLLIALGHDHQVVEAILRRVPLKEIGGLIEFLDLSFSGRILDPLSALQISPHQGIAERRSGGVGLDQLIHQRFELRIVLAHRPCQVLRSHDDVRAEG